MRKQLQEDAIRMAERLIGSLANPDPQEMDSFLSDRAVAIGPLERDWLLGKDKLEVALASLGMEHAVSSVKDFETHPYPLAGDACITASRFVATIRGELVACRLTMVWEEEEGRIACVHLHLSEAVAGARDEGEAEPAAEAQSIPRPVRESIALRDAQGVSHFLNLSDIVYVEANRQSTFVHTETGTFRMSEGISHLLERLDGCFIRIHRGYAVNVSHVVGMRPGYVILDEGTSLPVPARRVGEVKALLRRALRI